MYADHIEVYYKGHLVESGSGYTAPVISHRLPTHHRVAGGKPGAFARYQLQGADDVRHTRSWRRTRCVAGEASGRHRVRQDPAVKGGVILGHGVSTLSDYVRLSRQGKMRWIAMLGLRRCRRRGRATGGLSASCTSSRCSLCMLSSRAIPRMDSPLRFAFCTAFHLAV